VCSEACTRPLGTGDVDVDAIMKHLTGRGYDGRYVLEQDTILTGEPTGDGPVADALTSADNLRRALLATP
jgi:inosose dehydratase